MVNVLLNLTRSGPINSISQDPLLNSLSKTSPHSSPSLLRSDTPILGEDDSSSSAPEERNQSDKEKGGRGTTELHCLFGNSPPCQSHGRRRELGSVARVRTPSSIIGTIWVCDRLNSEELQPLVDEFGSRDRPCVPSLKFPPEVSQYSSHKSF